MKSILVSAVLMFLIFSSTTVVYSQFAVTDEDVLDHISEFYLVDQGLSNSNQGNLVPTGVIRGVGDVYYLSFEYEVIVKQGLDLNVTVEELLFSNSDVSIETLHSTFDFEIEQTITDSLGYQEHMLGQEVLANRVHVQVKVTMNELSYEVFQQLAGGSLSFELYFFAV